MALVGVASFYRPPLDHDSHSTLATNITENRGMAWSHWNQHSLVRCKRLVLCISECKLAMVNLYSLEGVAEVLDSSFRFQNFSHAKGGRHSKINQKEAKSLQTCQTNREHKRP